MDMTDTVEGKTAQYPDELRVSLQHSSFIKKVEGTWTSETIIKTEMKESSGITL